MSVLRLDRSDVDWQNQAPTEDEIASFKSLASEMHHRMNPMSFIRVRWLHTHANEPIWLISELDANRWETRKVEIFPDGSKGYASRHESVGGTILGELREPSLREISSDPQFLPEEISEEEFEAIWNDRQR
jgi:hypothetical protein